MQDIVNNAGVVLDRRTYGAFGDITSETDAAFQDRYGYAGGQLDPVTGFVRFGKRLDDTAAGRFTTPDPTGMSADSNYYRIDGNGPTYRTDPAGLAYKPIDAEDFWDLCDSLKITKGLDRGTAPYNQAIGAAFESVALKSLGVSKYTGEPFPTGRIRENHKGVIPEAALPQVIASTEGELETLKNSLFMDAKAHKGEIGIKYEDYQIKGYLWWLGQYSAAAKKGLLPVLHLVTFADTTVGADVLEYANARNVLVVQSKMEYDPATKKLRVGTGEVLNPDLLPEIIRKRGIPITGGAGAGVDQDDMKGS